MQSRLHFLQDDPSVRPNDGRQGAEHGCTSGLGRARIGAKMEKRWAGPHTVRINGPWPNVPRSLGRRRPYSCCTAEIGQRASLLKKKTTTTAPGTMCGEIGSPGTCADPLERLLLPAFSVSIINGLRSPARLRQTFLP
jgi:hypothetical protein